MPPIKFTPSPLNYTGGKHRLLTQIMPLFPTGIRTFVDLMCGGAVVGANVQCKKVIFNDINGRLIELLRTLCACTPQNTISQIKEIISRFGLSDSTANGYEYYGCDSASGLASFNREPFLRLRNELNATPCGSPGYSLMLYVAIIYAFNNQIRFNSRGQFNLPVGKRDFNSRIQNKLSAFVEKLRLINPEFTSQNFTEFNFNALGPRDFVYADPPYLITCAGYNENNAWTETHEQQLYHTLDNLSARGIRFALSNILSGKGKTNHILTRWLENRPALTCHHLNYSYSNSNYHKTDRLSASDEVLITNY